MHHGMHKKTRRHDHGDYQSKIHRESPPGAQPFRADEEFGKSMWFRFCNSSSEIGSRGRQRLRVGYGIGHGVSWKPASLLENANRAKRDCEASRTSYDFQRKFVAKIGRASCRERV